MPEQSGAAWMIQQLDAHHDLKAKPDRAIKSAEQGTVLAGGSLHCDADPEGQNHPVGTWYWFNPYTVPLTQYDLATSTLTTDAEVGGDGHTHTWALPAALKPPQPGDKVLVIWTLQGQMPWVIGPGILTTPAMFA